MEISLVIYLIIAAITFYFLGIIENDRTLKVFASILWPLTLVILCYEHVRLVIVNFFLTKKAKK
jgi:hypothetical protein